MKRFDLMHGINTRGTYLVSRACLPHLLKAGNPHVLMLSPPLNMEERWFAPHVAYSIAKFGMSLCVLGMAGEFRGRVAFNALWPRTVIATAAVRNLLGGDETMRRARSPEIVADAAHVILTQAHEHFTGRFCVDEDLLREHGVSDFSKYSDVPESELLPDFFV
jgi:citronellol/citronellal dehydrogenase